MKLEYKSYYKKLGLNIAYYRKSNGFTQEDAGGKNRHRPDPHE